MLWMALTWEMILIWEMILRDVTGMTKTCLQNLWAPHHHPRCQLQQRQQRCQQRCQQKKPGHSERSKCTTTWFVMMAKVDSRNNQVSQAKITVEIVVKASPHAHTLCITTRTTYASFVTALLQPPAVTLKATLRTRCTDVLVDDYLKSN